MIDFFANLFEFFGYNYTDMSDDLLEIGIYTTVGWLVLLIPLIAAVLYYYVFDKARYVAWYHWLFVGLIESLLVAIFTYIYTERTFYNEGLEYYFHEYLNFTGVTFFYCLLFFFIYSMLIKWKSKNRRRTPF